MQNIRLLSRLWLPTSLMLLALSFLASSACADTPATYYLVPLHGVIGRQITAPVLDEMLQDARKARPDVVVLEIESPGGHVAELEGLLKAIADARDLRLVAYVHTALGAAAPLALACRDIYVVPSVAIGGPFSFTGAPVTGKIDEKFLAMWRDSCQSAAQLGGHSLLLAKGIADPALELSIAQVNGKPEVVQGPEGAPLKKPGVVLTLSAKNAVASGLALAEIGSYADLGRTLGFPNWQGSGTRGQQILGRHTSELAKTESDLIKKAGVGQLRISRWANYLAAMPQIDKLDKDLSATADQGKATDQALAALKNQYDSDMKNIQQTYQNDMDAAGDDRRLQSNASHKRTDSITALNQRYQPQISALKGKNASLVDKYKQLLSERKSFILTLELP